MQRTLTDAITLVKTRSKEDAKLDLDRYRRYRQELKDNYAAKIKDRVTRTENAYLAYQILTGAGFAPTLDLWWVNCMCRLDCKKTDLPKIRQALGVPLLHTGDRELVAKSSTKVWVTLSNPEHFPQLTIRYQTRIPAGAKCQVVVERRTERRLVCQL